MAKIEFKRTLEDLVKDAASCAREGKYVLCVHNLKDALKEATTAQERASVYKCYSDMFGSIGNNVMAQEALFRACMEVDNGGYYSLSYEKFFPFDGYVEDEELPPPDAETILAYNDVYNCFRLGQYDKGLDVLCELPPDLKSLDEVVGVLYDAVEEGKKVDLSSHAYKLLLLAGIFSMKSGDFVRIMLQGSAITRALMVDGVKFFADEIEDRRILTNVGEAFVNEHEYECAEICFEKALHDCEIDELSLYYLTAINYANGNPQKAEKYWNVYKLCYKPFGAPIEGFMRLFQAGVILEYGAIPEKYVKEDVNDVLYTEEAEADPFLYKQAAINALSYCREQQFMKLIRNTDFTYPLMEQAVKETLISPFVGDERKKRILGELLRAGYEGRVAVSFKDKACMFDCMKFTVRGNKAIWHTIFERISAGIICSKSFIPYKPSYLSAEIKLFAKSCAELDIKVEEDDVPFLSTILATNYNDKTKSNNNIGWVYDILPPLSQEELRRGLKKFPPEVLKF